MSQKIASARASVRGQTTCVHIHRILVNQQNVVRTLFDEHPYAKTHFRTPGSKSKSSKIVTFDENPYAKMHFRTRVTRLAIIILLRH